MITKRERKLMRRGKWRREGRNGNSACACCLSPSTCHATGDSLHDFSTFLVAKLIDDKLARIWLENNEFFFVWQSSIILFSST